MHERTGAAAVVVGGDVRPAERSADESNDGTGRSMVMPLASWDHRSMCGRLNMSTDPADLADELQIEMMTYTYAPRYNVPPGAPLPILVDRPDDEGTLFRRLETVRWGLVPGWAKDEKIGFRAFNARSETVEDKPMFRKAFESRRCVVPVTGYYEWHATETGKEPWLMHAADGGPLFMAGLFEFRKRGEADGPTADPAVRDGWLVSTTIITAPAAGHLAELHDRMPVMLPRDLLAAWMDPGAGGAEAREMLKALVADFDPGRVDRYRVSTAVGNVRNQGAELAEPLGDEL